MKRVANLTIIGAIVVAAAIAVGIPSVLAQGAPEMGTGSGMMGAQSDEGGSMMGPGMMGRGMGGGRMMGMMGGGCPMMGMMMGGKAPIYAQGRIAFLKAELAITDAQAKVWEDYANTLKKNMESMQSMRQSMMSAQSEKTPVARLDAHIKAMEGRLQALKDVKPALGALYDSLSDDQKKKADELLTGMGCMM